MSEETKNTEKVACDLKLSRKEFLADVLKKAVLAGTIVAAPKVLDKFLIPPVYAANSTNTFADHHFTNGGADTLPSGQSDSSSGTGSGTDGLGRPTFHDNGGYSE